MANYGYGSRGYTTSNDMDGGGYTYSEHVCRPVIIDAEGRKQPIIRYTPNDSYVVKRETIIERVHSPVAEYKNYGVHNDKWRRPSSPIHDKWHRPSSPIHDHDRPHTTVEHYRYGSDSPTKYEVNDDKWHRPSSPNYDRPRKVDDKWHRPSSPNYDRPHKVDDKWHRPSSPNYDRPRKVEEFITKVQTEVSQPRIGPLTSSYRRNSANPNGHTESTGHGDWKKPSGNAIRDHTESTDYGDWNKPSGNAIRDERLTEPTMVNSGGWSRPAPLGWTKPAGRPLTGPTTDINDAVNFLKEAVKSSSITTGAPNSRYTEPATGFSKKDGYTETIDSSEAKKRYARPVFKPSESYNGKISSKDAIDKYGGAFVP